MNNILLEVCCGSADDVIQAHLGGANRVELNSCLFHGGLTPSVGELIVAKKSVPIPVMTMIRPRQGGFCYTAAEFETALEDAKVLLKYGSDGLVFGFLNADGTLDEEKCRALTELAGDKETVFHRAIDVVPDWRKTLERLIHMGVTRVLTSGQASDVFYGTDVIREMVDFAQGAIQIMPGAGVNVKNIERILRETGCSQIHAARFKKCADASTDNNQDIYFGGALYPPENSYDVTDQAYIKQLHNQCNAN